MYAVGSAKLGKECSLNNITRIFNLQELEWVPNKWFVAMSDVFTQGFKAAFKRDSCNSNEKAALLINPIYRDNDNNAVTNFHPIHSFDNSEEDEKSNNNICT